MAEPDPPLDLALALVAATGRPQVDPVAIIERLDGLAAALGDVDGAGVLCAAVFGPDGFSGDRKDYYDPRNSLLDEVLERRRGIPITLAAVAIELGRRCGVELVGVGMPGHFLLGAPGPAGESSSVGASALEFPVRWFDAFDSGRELDEDGCARIFNDLHGPAMPFDRSMLSSVGTHAMVVRVLNNLLGARTKRRDRSGVADVLALRVASSPTELAPRRQLAAALAAAGRFDEAATVHDDLATADPGAASGHARAAGALRARLN